MRRSLAVAISVIALVAGACTDGGPEGSGPGATVSAVPSTADVAGTTGDPSTTDDDPPAVTAEDDAAAPVASGALDAADPGSGRSSSAADELVATLPSLPELGRYDEPADVWVAPGGGGTGASPDDPLGSVVDAVRRAGEGGIVELAPGAYGDVELPPLEESERWEDPVVIRASTPADWREAWRIVAEEDYLLDDDGEVAPATFEGVWTTELASFRSEMTGVQLVGVGIAGQVAVRDAHVDFDRIVSAAPNNAWYPRSDFTLSRSVLAWPVAVESGDRLQIAGDDAEGNTVVLDRVMLGNVFRRLGSDSHSDSLQTLTGARVVVRRSALLAAANRVQLSSIGEGSVLADTYIESFGDARRAGFFVPPSADTSSTDSAIMADGLAPTLVRVRVLGGVNDVSADTPFTVLDSIVRGYGGDLDEWSGTLLEDGPTDGLPDEAGNEAGTVVQQRPGPPAD